MTTPAKPAPQFVEVPSGTRAAECKGCKATIYWIVTEAGKRMPVNCDLEGGLRPARFRVAGSTDPRDNGRGIPHFIDCPSASAFRRAR